MKATSSERTVATEDRRLAPSLAEACRFWLKFGFISFGGPTAQIALLHGELVEKKKWISETRFFHALNFSMLLPGPEAHQLAIYIGWLLHKIRGGVIAGTLFVLPAAVFLWGLTWVYAAYGNIAWVAAIFFGIKPAVMAIVAEAVIRIGSRALKNEVMCSLAFGVGGMTRFSVKVCSLAKRRLSLSAVLMLYCNTSPRTRWSIFTG